MEKGKEDQEKGGDGQPPLIQGILYNKHGLQVLYNRMKNVQVITAIAYSKHDSNMKGTAELLISGESAPMPAINLNKNETFTINPKYMLPRRVLFINVSEGSAINIVARGYSVTDKGEMAEFIPNVSASELLKPALFAPLSELSIKLFRRRAIATDLNSKSIFVDSIILNFGIEVPNVLIVRDKADGNALMLSIDEKSHILRLNSTDEAYEACKKAKEFLRTSNEMPFGELKDDELL